MIHGQVPVIASQVTALDEHFPGLLDAVSSFRVTQSHRGRVLHSPKCSQANLSEPLTEIDVRADSDFETCISCVYSTPFHGVNPPLLNAAHRLVSAEPGSVEHYASSVWLGTRYFGIGHGSWSTMNRDGVHQGLLKALRPLMDVDSPLSWPSRPQKGRWSVLLPGWENGSNFPADPALVHLTMRSDLHLLVWSPLGADAFTGFRPERARDLGEGSAADTPMVLETALALFAEQDNPRNALRFGRPEEFDALETARALELEV